MPGKMAQIYNVVSSLPSKKYANSEIVENPLHSLKKGEVRSR